MSDEINKRAGELYELYNKATEGLIPMRMPNWVEFSEDPRSKVLVDAWRAMARLSLEFPRPEQRRRIIVLPLDAEAGVMHDLLEAGYLPIRVKCPADIRILDGGAGEMIAG